VEPQPYATADVSDAAGEHVAMHPRIRPAWHGARVVGPAFTVRTPPGQHPAVRQALERATPGDVIVIDGGASTERALWGDKLSALALERGIAGVVIDGALLGVHGSIVRPADGGTQGRMALDRDGSMWSSEGTGPEGRSPCGS